MLAAVRWAITSAQAHTWRFRRSVLQHSIQPGRQVPRARPSHPGIGILTERDVLDSVGAGQDPDAEVVSDHRTADVVFASPEWTLEQAAGAMSAGNFRHLIVMDGHEVVGLLAMRDIVRCWAVPTGPCATPPYRP
jgi:signal-transduction protein with cAMP-binding, CBS, and nucleotidyltransferase domain